MVRRIFLSLALPFALAACSGRVPSPPVADLDISQFHFNAPPEFYPTDLLVQRKEGHATVECLFTVEGSPQDCEIVETEGGDAFGPAALDFLSHRHFRPFFYNGARERWTVAFALAGMTDRPNPGGAADLSALTSIEPPRAVGGLAPVYPERLRQGGYEGSAEVTCRITVDGFARNCVAVDSFGGSEFVDAVLDYVTHVRFAPELNQGVPVEVQHDITINFRKFGTTLSPDIPARPFNTTHSHAVITLASDQPIGGPALVFPPEMLVRSRPGLVSVQCTVTVGGTTRDCLVLESTGDREFEAAALDILSHARFAPATVDGKAVEAPHKWRLFYGK